MYAEKLLVHNGRQRQTVKCIHTRIIHLLRVLYLTCQKTTTTTTTTDTTITEKKTKMTTAAAAATATALARKTTIATIFISFYFSLHAVHMNSYAIQYNSCNNVTHMISATYTLA